jgi:sugar transferase (PEP-CTERM/EpsH1 system associated)
VSALAHGRPGARGGTGRGGALDTPGGGADHPLSPPPLAATDPEWIATVKILFMTPRLPSPPLRGDQTVAFHRLRTLSPRHEIVLLTFYERESDLEGLRQLRPWCAAVHAVKLPPWRSYANMLALGPLSRAPLQVLYYRSRAFRLKLDELLAAGSFDVVHCFLLRLAPYLRGVRVPRVLELVDSMQLNMGRTAQASSGLRRLLYREELRRVEALEHSADQLAERLVLVSELDRAMIPSDRTLVLPNGVVCGAPPAPDREGAAPAVVFFGNMGYAPNVDAAAWFADRCWAAVREAVPHAELWIVGDRPGRAVRALASRPGIRVTGRVPDMARAVSPAQVAIAPLRSGSGIQNKVLEAMAIGLPVVTTPTGLGSISARPGHDLLVADDAAGFAAAVIDLLRDPARRGSLSRHGRAFVEAQHSWERAADQLDALYAALGRGPAEPTAR